MGQLINENELKACEFCGYWESHTPNCSRPKATVRPAMFPNNESSKQVVKPLERKVTATLPIDEKASISVEIVDKRHIVIRRWSNRNGVRSINLHYDNAEKAERYLDDVLSYAKRIGAEIIQEAKQAFNFNGMAGKFTVDTPDIGKIAL